MTGLDEYLEVPDITPDDITNMITAFSLIATWEDSIDVDQGPNEIFETRELALIRKILSSNMDNLSPALINRLTNRIKKLMGK